LPWLAVFSPCRFRPGQLTGVDEAHGHAIGLVKETRGLPALVVNSMGEENGAP
jgi:hypothetical protein